MSDSTSVVAAIDSLVRGVKVSDAREAFRALEVAAACYAAVCMFLVLATFWFIWRVWREVFK